MKVTQEQLKQMRILVSQLGWGEFMRNVGSLMAEQADKTSGEQETNLFNCSRTIHTLNPFFEKCRGFEYPQSLVGETGLPDDQFPFGRAKQ